MTQPTVLIIDDEPDILELLEMTLGRMDLLTRRASTLEQALALLDAESFDLCLTDMRLPDGDGMTIVRHIQQHCPATPEACRIGGARSGSRGTSKSASRSAAIPTS